MVLGILVSALPMAHALGGPTLTILSPAGALSPSSTVRTSFIVSFTVSNFSFVEPGTVGITNSPNEGHIHVFLDGDYYAIQDNVGPIAFYDIAPGTHTVKLQLVNNDHTSFSPDVSQTITVDASSGVDTTVNAIQNWVMINTAIIVITLILVILLLIRKR